MRRAFIVFSHKPFCGRPLVCWFLKTRLFVTVSDYFFHFHNSIMERRPYLDKIVDNPHVPHTEGYTDLNSIATFPNLKHTGLRSSFEPVTVTVATPDGRITSDFKQQSYHTLRDIYREDIELKSREDTFKKSHKQFMDDILQDMETKKRAGLERKTKYFNSKKAKLGFSDKFNELDHNHDSSLESSQEIIPKTMPSTSQTVRTALSSYNAEGRKQRSVNRVTLFKNLLETTAPPKSPTQRFGTLSVKR
jgi:hypothetical protein